MPAPTKARAFLGTYEALQAPHVWKIRPMPAGAGFPISSVVNGALLRRVSNRHIIKQGEGMKAREKDPPVMAYCGTCGHKTYYVPDTCPSCGSRYIKKSKPQ